MRPNLPRLTGTALAAASGAGIAGALLSMLTVQKTSIALMLGFVAPLPIMIASLGFGSLAGVIAIVVGAISVGLFDFKPEGLSFFKPENLGAAGLDILVFLISLGIPAWLMSRLALLPYDAAAALRATKVGRPVRPEEYVLGLIVAAAVGCAAVSVAADFVISIAKQGGFDAFMAGATDRAEAAIKSLLAARNRPLPDGLGPHDLAVAITWAQMPLMAAAEVVVLVANLWLAARIAQTSNLLAAAWPDIPRFMRAPRILALLLAVALGLCFARGLIGMVSLIVSGALLMAFTLQGLAVVHAMTRGKQIRFPLLVLVYLSLVMLMPWLLIFYGLIGLLDTVFAFRDRQEAALKAKQETIRKDSPWK